MPRVIILALIVYWLALFTVTHIPAPKLPDTHVNDKIEHFVAYGLLAGLLYLVVARRARGPLMVAALVLCIAAAYGAIDEWLQQYVQRSCDFHDWLADMTGACIAVALLLPLHLLLRRRRQRATNSEQQTTSHE